MWSVRDRAIYAESTETGPAGRTFIIWRGGEPGNFELKFECKWVGPGNGGMQIHGWVVPYKTGSGAPSPVAGQAAAGRGGGGRGENAAALFVAGRERWNIAGYQINISNIDAGSMYEIATNRGFLTAMGRFNRLEEGKPYTTVAMIKPYDQLLNDYKKDDWNRYHIIARDNMIAGIINDQLYSLTVDYDYGKRRMKGLLAIEIETRGSSQVFTKNLMLRNLPD